MASFDDAATLVRERGWPVFPLRAGAKEPLTSRGFHDATVDLEVVRQWWELHDGANVGVPTGIASGIVVIDVDDLDALSLLPEPMPRTLRLSTGKGLHFVFAHPGFEVRNSASKIAPGIDVRGDGGYIVAPGSTHPNGKPYAVVDPSPISALPGWLVPVLRGDRPERSSVPVPPDGTSAPAPATLASEDTAYGLAAYDAEIAALSGTPEGQRNDALNRCAFALFGLVKGGELTDATARGALEAAARAIGLGEREISKTLRSAFLAAEPRSKPNTNDPTLLVDPLDGRNVRGVRLPPPDDDGGTVETSEPTALDLVRSKLVDVDALLAMKPPEWLIDDLLVRDSLSVIYGKPGSRKTFLALDLALCVASASWWKGHAVSKGSVLYVAAEGVAGLGRRVRAWQVANRVERIDGIRWFPQGVPLLALDQVFLLEELVRAESFDLVIFDTLARCMVGGDENSALDMGRAVQALDRIRHASAAHVAAVHHDTKDGGTPRGSSALIGAVDTILSVEAEGDRTTITVEKQKDAEAGRPTVLFARPCEESITLETVAERAADPRSEALETLRALREIEGTSGIGRRDWQEAASAARTTFNRHAAWLAENRYVVERGNGNAARYQTTAEGRAALVGMT